MSFGDLLGWCLAFLLPVFALAGPLRRDEGAAHAYLLAVILHVAAAAIYVYLPGVLPARGDANAFHKTAVAFQMWSEWPFGLSSLLFKWTLAHLYSSVGPSFFFASVLSIYAFAVSAVVLAKLMELLDIRDGKGSVILLFGALPTAVLYGSVPLREPYQIMFFMLACYSMLRFRVSSQPLHLIAAIVFALMMGLLHKGLLLYAPLLIVIMLAVRVDEPGSHSTGRRVYLHRFAAIALATGFVVWMSGDAQKLEGVHGTEVLLATTIGDGLIGSAMERRDKEASSLSKGRTAYSVELNSSSPIHFLYSSMRILFYYLFTPFPWQVRNLLDAYAFGEVVVRILCLVAIFRMWRRGGPVHPQIVTLLMVVYLSMAFLWAAGTTNYGTATRHHMIHQWILLLLGVPALTQMRSGFARGHVTSKPAAAPRFSGSRSLRIQPRIPHLRCLTGTSTPPPRLDFERSPRRSFEVANAAPRLWAGGLRRPRRLTEE